MVLKGPEILADQSFNTVPGAQSHLPRPNETPDSSGLTSSLPQVRQSEILAHMSHSSESTSESSGPGVDTGDESDGEVNTSAASGPGRSMLQNDGAHRPGQPLNVNRKPLPFPPERKTAEPIVHKDLPSIPTSDLSESQRADFEARYPPIIHELDSLSLGGQNPVASRSALNGDKTAYQEPARGPEEPRPHASGVSQEANLGSTASRPDVPRKKELPGSSGVAQTGNVPSTEPTHVPRVETTDEAQPGISSLVDKAFSQQPELSTQDASDGPQVQPQETGTPFEDRWWEEPGVFDQGITLNKQTVDNVAQSSGQAADNAAIIAAQPVSTHQPDGLLPSEEIQQLQHTKPEPAASDVRPEPATAPSVTEAERDAAQPTKPPPTSETYQIRHINWTDGKSSGLRRSPILVQNANGPCPLVALVNALSLSAAPESQSALIETLRVREQISLGFLLDAVLDELMSSRAGVAAPELPDIGDLYNFLTTLHTGMNVNPRFVPVQQSTPNLIDAPIDAPNESQPAQGGVVPGSFEETQGMQLYGTFSIPLVHGWLPSKDHPAYAALQRSAQTYEDAQNLLFREEELEDKLRREGLNRDEQQMLQDVVIVKYFLAQSATQLTKHGLEVLSQALTPGSLSILFRNDHFSTIYKHPSSHQLLQLVTDAGYASHAEIVWESLVDVTGEGSEFFAGDFRPVGNHEAEPPRAQPSQQVRSLLDDEPVWTTVQDRRNKHRRKTSRRSNGNAMGSIGERLDTNVTIPTTGTFATDTAPPRSPTTEQEDHDLALAMQLQEEEDDLLRRDQAARVGQSFAESVGTPPRTRPGGLRPPGATRAAPVRQEIRPLIPPLGSSPQRPPPQQRPPPPARRPQQQQPPAMVDSSADDVLDTDVPPPSYEQAAQGDPYYPPPDHPAHSSSPAQQHPPSSSRPAISRNAPSSERGEGLGRLHTHQQPSSGSPSSATAPGIPSPSSSNSRRHSRATRERYMLGNHAEFMGATSSSGGGGSSRRRQSAGLGPLSAGVAASSSTSSGSAGGSVDTKRECIVM